MLPRTKGIATSHMFVPSQRISPNCTVRTICEDTTDDLRGHHGLTDGTDRTGDTEATDLGARGGGRSKGRTGSRSCCET